MMHSKGVIRAGLNHSPTRGVFVVFGSVAVYLALGLPVYWLYFKISGTIYDPTLREGLAALEAVFYVSYALHLIGSLAGSALLSKWARAPLFPVLIAFGLLLAILAYPTIATLSFLNVCESNVSFPMGGMNC